MLRSALRSAVQTRFPEINSSSKDAQLTAIANMRYKLDWLDDQAEKIRMISLLKERVAALHALEQQIASKRQAQQSEQTQGVLTILVRKSTNLFVMVQQG